MPKPPLKKYPAEIFGYPYTNNTPEVKKTREEQYCPFLEGNVKSQEKANLTSRLEYAA